MLVSLLIFLPILSKVVFIIIRNVRSSAGAVYIGYFMFLFLCLLFLFYWSLQTFLRQMRFNSRAYSTSFMLSRQYLKLLLMKRLTTIIYILILLQAQQASASPQCKHWPSNSQRTINEPNDLHLGHKRARSYFACCVMVIPFPTVYCVLFLCPSQSHFCFEILT